MNTGPTSDVSSSGQSYIPLQELRQKATLGSVKVTRGLDTTPVTKGEVRETVRHIKKLFNEEVALPSLFSSRHTLQALKDHAVEEVHGNKSFLKKIKTWFATRQFDSMLTKINKKIETSWGTINKDNIEKLCEGIRPEDVNEQDSTGKTLLHYAAALHNEGAVQVLLEKAGVDVVVQDDEGNTSLHYAAAAEGGLPVVKLLIEKSTPQDLCLQNHDGDTPLHLALISGREDDIVKVLIEKSPKEVCDTQNNDKETPLHLALKFGRKEDIPRLMVGRLQSKGSSSGN